MTEEEKRILKDAYDTIETLRIQLQQTAGEKSVRSLVEEINKSFSGPFKSLTENLQTAVKSLQEIASANIIDKEALMKVIQDIKVEPQIKIEIPDISVPEAKVKVEIPPIKIPPIKVPKPEVTVEVPPVNFPKEMTIKGIAGFFKSVVDAIKGVLKVDIGHKRDNPLPVILVDKPTNGDYYKAGGMITTGFGGGGGPGSGKRSGTMLTEDTLTLTNANTQYTYVLPGGVKALSFRLRSGDYALQHSFQALSEGKYRTLPAGVAYNRENIDIDVKTLYFRCVDNAGEIIELEIWT
jgi:hypothetical protein